MRNRKKQNLILTIMVGMVLLITPLSAYASTAAPAPAGQQDSAESVSFACPYPWGERDYFLRQPNMTGKAVREIQRRLNLHGAGPLIEVDGIFGPRTRQAVTNFQQDVGLEADGIVGPRTKAKLNQVCVGFPTKRPPP